jgi:hypothetical protein
MDSSSFTRLHHAFATGVARAIPSAPPPVAARKRKQVIAASVRRTLLLKGEVCGRIPASTL